MSHYIPLICTNCQRTRNVRSSYLGSWVICNHCDHSFRVVEVDRVTASPSVAIGPRIAEPTSAASQASRNGDADVLPLADGHEDRVAAQIELEQIREENLFLQRQLAMAEAVAGELESTREETRRRVTTVEVLKAELGDRLAEIETLRRSTEQLVAVLAARDQAEAGRQASVARAEQAEASLAEALREFDALLSQSDAARLDREHLHASDLLRWEAERTALVADREAECRSLREEAERALRTEVSAASAQQQVLLHQLEDVRGQLEQYQLNSRAEYEILLAELATVTALRNAAIDQAERFREELDATEDRESHWERILAETATRHRDEIDTLAGELQMVRDRAEESARREVATEERLRTVQDELDRLRRDLSDSDEPAAVQSALDAQRIEGDSLRFERDQLVAERDLLVGDRAGMLEALRAIEDRERLGRDVFDHERQLVETARDEAREQLAALRLEAEAESRSATSLRDELAALQETVERLQQERAAAEERSGRLRIERDQKHDSQVRLETLNREIEERHRAEIERLSLERDEARQCADSSSLRVAEPAGQIDSSSDPVVLPNHAQEDSASPRLADPSSSVQAHSVTDIDRPASRDIDLLVAGTLPVEPTERTEEDSQASHDPNMTSTGIAEDSPEVRIQTLRDSLRCAHAAHLRAQEHRPIYTRLVQVLKYCVPRR